MLPEWHGGRNSQSEPASNGRRSFRPSFRCFRFFRNAEFWLIPFSGDFGMMGLAKIGRLSGSLVAASAMLALAVPGSNEAIAQAVVPPQTANTPNCTFVSTANPPVSGITNLNSLAAPAAAVSGAIAGAVGNINTIFLGQQGNAFVSAPPNPAPGQPGGGVWGRVIGGEITLKSNSVSQGAAVVPA